MANVTLNWVAPLESVGGVAATYTVYRVNGSQTTGSTIAHADNTTADVDAPTVTYVDSSGVAGTTYSYVVTARNVVGESDPSNVVEVVIPS